MNRIFHGTRHRNDLFCYSLILAPLFLVSGVDAVSQESLQQRIVHIGNQDNDEQQLLLLRQLREELQRSPDLRADLDRLIEQIDRYLHNPKLDYFGSAILKTDSWDFGISQDSPFMPLTYLYQARMLLWCGMEHGNIWSVPDRRRAVFDKAVAWLEKAREHFPQNRMIRMYLGEPIPCDPLEHPVPEAPEWARFQREGLERLADIIEWWIDNRMQENGEFGGGWGDDCEMWRWWTPILIGFESPKINQAQARFSRAILSQAHMKDGYSAHLTDVEHSSEDSADAITPMMHLEPDNPEWRDKALRLVDLMETLWSGKNERGFLQFKSIDFSVDKIRSNPERACDTVYHPRAMQPALLYWQRTNDPRCRALFTAWMDTWADATCRAERGKPAGIIPSAIHWPDGQVGGLGDQWWNPEEDREASLYRWPSAMGQMTNTLLQTYAMTHDKKYLEPIRSMAEIRRHYLKQKPQGSPEPGSESWCAEKIGLGDVLAKHRFLTNTPEFDDLLADSASPYLQFRLHEDTGSLVKGLEKNAKALGVNFAGYTREVRYTDRVLRFPALFAAGYLFPQEVPEIVSPSPELLYSTVTGDPGGVLYFPLNRVRWLTPPREIAALVTKTGPDYLEAELFHFGDQPRKMGAELYLFDAGSYVYSIQGGDTPYSGKVEIVGARTKVSFTLPPRCVSVLKIEKDNDK